MLRLATAVDDATPKEKMRAAFDMVDLDKSGYLDAEEVSEALKSLDSDLNKAGTTECHPSRVAVQGRLKVCAVLRRDFSEIQRQ